MLHAYCLFLTYVDVNYSGSAVGLKCAIDVTQKPQSQELSLFSNLPHPIGVRHHHQNKRTLAARIIFSSSSTTERPSY